MKNNNFTDKEFKEKMLKAETDVLISFLEKDFLIFDKQGNMTGTIDIKSAIDETFSQMPEEELQAYWSIL